MNLNALSQERFKNARLTKSNEELKKVIQSQDKEITKLRKELRRRDSATVETPFGRDVVVKGIESEYFGLFGSY